MGRQMTLHFDSASLSDIKDLNASFATGRLRVMYTGANRNGSEFSQEVVEAALPSLRNVPIVAHYDEEDNEIGAHDMELKRDGDKLRLKNLTEPCGVVPESAQAYFSEEEDAKGVTHNYLVVEPVILWKRQEVYRHIADDMGGQVNHSMEVNITAYHKDKESKLMTVDAFQFEALCLLERAKPCYEGSELALFDARDFKEQMTQMMNELRETFAQVNPPKAEIDIEEDNKEGGRVLDEKLALLNEYGLDAGTLGFSIDDFSVEELREKCEAMKEAEKEADAEAPQTFELAGNLEKVLADAFRERKIRKPWGEEPAYCLEDYDQDAGMAYAIAHQDWNVYGFPFSMDGDRAVIDFDAGRRMKRAYVEFDEGAREDASARLMRDMEQRYSENDAQWSKKNEELQAAFDELKENTADVEELRKFKHDAEQKAENDALAEKRGEVFAMFEDLADVEEFKELCANAEKEPAAYSDMEALKEKCYAIRGRNRTPAKFSLEEKAPKQKVVRREIKDEPYGGLFARYGYEVEETE